MRWLQRGAMLVTTMAIVSSATACASKGSRVTSTAPDSGAGTAISRSIAHRAPAASATCAARQGALRTMPSVAKRDQVSDTPTHYAPTRPLSELPPRSTNVAAVLHRVRAGLDPSVRLCAVITAHGPSRGFPGPWMTASAHVTSEQPVATMYGQWQIQLLAGASAELFNVSGQSNLENVLVGLTPRTVAAGGRTGATSAARLGAVRAGQQFLSNGLSDAQAVRAVKDAVERAGGKPLSVRVWHPLGKAVSVTMQVADLAAFRRTGWDSLNRSMLESPAEFEGVYVAVDAPDGKPLACFASARRVGAGSQWESPRAGFGYAHA